MHELNQNQMILLVLLISFVTSIATGIMTVSLLQEAPLEVTRNINRVVEKTIETVVPSGTNILGNKDTTKEVTTVVVKEDDLVVSSVEKNIKSVVRIYEENNLGTRDFYGVGVVISDDGNIIADRKTISNTNIYYVKFSDDSEFKLVPKGVDKDTGSIIFKVNLPVDKKYTFIPVKFSSSDPQLGQTIIALGGDTKNVVVVGRVSSLNMKEVSNASSTDKYISSVDTDMSSNNLFSGTPFFNLSGDFIGIKLSVGSSSFTPISIVNKETKVILE